jgi:quercetin dioxygenase-like cupin family protein
MHKTMKSTPGAVSADTAQFGIPGTHREPFATGGPVLGIDLPRVLCQLRHERTSSGNRTAITLVKHRDFRLVLVVLKPGACLARHDVRGTVLIQILTGKVRIGILGEHLEASAGQVISLDPNLPHEVKAVEDTALLISIAWPGACLPLSAVSTHQPKAEDVSCEWTADDSVWN